MSDKPWEDYAASKPWEDFKAPEPKTVVSGKFLPISKNDRGEVFFDSNAGVVGAVKRAFNLPGEVMRGEVDMRTEEGLGRALEMTGVISPLPAATRAMGMGGLNALRPRPAAVEPPTAEGLRAAASSGYNAAREAGVEFSSDAVKNVASALMANLEKDGIIGELAPKTFGILRKLTEPPAGSVAPLAGVEAARRAFGHAGKDFANPTEQLAAGRVVQGLDQFLEQPAAGAVIKGDAQAAGKVLADARKNYGAAARSDQITRAEESAELGAAVANSGRNLDNALRQRAKGIIDSPKKSAGYSAEEIVALDTAARGTFARNRVRDIGNLLGGGGGLGAVAAGAAGAAGGTFLGGLPGFVAGVGVPAIGMGAKYLGGHLTDNAMRVADALVRQRSPLYEGMRQGSSKETSGPALESLMSVVRALMAQDQNR